MDSAFRHCEELVRAADKDRFLATLFAPADKRGPLFALYAFNAEIAGIRDRIREPMAGEIRLQWWRDVLNGERGGEAAANPVAAGLLRAMAEHALPAQQLYDLVEAHAFDLYDDPMPTMEALEGYVRHTSGTVFDMAARICGASAAHAAELAGLAYGITGLLRTFALQASRRQFFVPEQLLDGGATPEQTFAGRSSPALISALGTLCARAREHIAAFERELEQARRTTMPALLPAALVPGYLAVMSRPDYDPFRTPVEVPQWRRQWALWRAARRYARVMA
jgi:phytoene synthase